MRDEADDGAVPGPPLPPEDRLWRHPSELAGTTPRTAVLPAASGPEGGGIRRRALVAVAVLSGLTGAAATVTTLMALGALATRVEERPPRQPLADVTTTTATRTARSLAAAVAPAVVEVTATAGDRHQRGSGVVVREDGLILTSAQLVANATEVVVTWSTGRSGPATVVGHDRLTGLAAIDVAGAGHPTVPLDTTPPEPGQRAITVAAWGGAVGPTLTQGLISTVGSHVDPEGGRLLGLIETDNPVPARADGGALIDDQGQVRGVCISVESAVTTGFAVPAVVALRVAHDLDELGRVDRGWLGIRGSSSEPDGWVPAGVRVEEVADGSPADRAGLVPGDVIIAVDQGRVRSLADVQAALTLTRPGQGVELERARDGQVATVAVTLAPTP